MEMTLRWYGSKFDTVTLEQIRQIPGVTGMIPTLYDTTPGEVWMREAIHALKEEVEASGLHISGIESVNIHDAIKIGSPDRAIHLEKPDFPEYVEKLAAAAGCFVSDHSLEGCFYVPCSFISKHSATTRSGCSVRSVPIPALTA